MNAFDRKIAAALKVLAKPHASAEAQQKSREALTDAKARNPDAALRKALDSSVHMLASRMDETKRLPGTDYLALIQTLNAHALPLTSEVLFTSFIGSLKNLDANLLFKAAPTVKSVVVFLRASGLRNKSFEEKLLTNPESAYTTTALDWHLEKGDARRCAPFLTMLLARLPRPKHLPQWDEVITETLQKPKACQLLKILLEAESPGSQQLETLAALLLSDASLLKGIADLLPNLLESGIPQQALQFLKLLLERILVAPPQQRPLFSAVIARLGSNLLFREDPSPGHQESLKAIEEATSRLKLATTDAELKARTWVFERLKTAAERLDDNQHLTMTGARHMAVAFEMAGQGFSAYAVLSMTAKNLGMIAYGAKDEKVTYNPLQHEDIEGLLALGEAAQVLESGWRFKNSIVLRARVIRPATIKTPGSL